MKASELIHKINKLMCQYGDQEVWIYNNKNVFPISSNINSDADETTFYLSTENQEGKRCATCRCLNVDLYHSPCNDCRREIDGKIIHRNWKQKERK